MNKNVTVPVGATAPGSGRSPLYRRDELPRASDLAADASASANASADVASGGEGAPLVPFFHFACARRIGAARARRGKAVNLDPAALLMDMFLQIEQTAATLAAR